MDERLRFVARHLEGKKMSALCREFGVSRRTGYQIINRYKELGLDGLEDRSRRPHRHANQLPFQVKRTILSIKREYPSWGARKIRDKLLNEFSQIEQRTHEGLPQHDGSDDDPQSLQVQEL